MSPTTPDRKATPADPGATDLEEFKRFLHTLDKEAHLSPHAGTAHGHISNLIAAVEALRTRVAELEANPAFLGDMQKAQRQLVTALEDKEVAEAREAALAGALEAVRDQWCSEHCPIDNNAVALGHLKVCETATTVLAATSPARPERSAARKPAQSIVFLKCDTETADG